jgi:polyisoprenoid-binding protein YceI
MILPPDGFLTPKVIREIYDPASLERRASMKRIPALIGAIAFSSGFLAALQQPAAAPGAVQEFTIDDAWGRDTVQFLTSAPLEEIVGTTNEVTGVLKADPKNLAGPGTAARIEVVLKTIKTGIEMRDGAVAKALGAEKNPVAVFTLERVKSASPNALEPNIPVAVVGEGTLELKGVKKKIDVAAKLTYVPRGSPFNQMRPGSFVKLIANFDVNLADFGVERRGPVLPLQVGEQAHVSVTALASDATPEEAKRYRDSAVKYMGKARR